MTEEIRHLIEGLRRGDAPSPGRKGHLLLAAALREEPGAETDLLLSLLTPRQIPLRLAAVEASPHRREPEILNALLKLAAVPETSVRQKLALTIRATPTRRLPNDHPRTVRGPRWRGPRLSHTRRRVELGPHFGCFITILNRDDDWEVRLACVDALAKHGMFPGLNALLTALARDPDDDVQKRCAAVLENLLPVPSDPKSNLLIDDSQILEACARFAQILRQCPPSQSCAAGSRSGESPKPIQRSWPSSAPISPHSPSRAPCRGRRHLGEPPIAPRQALPGATRLGRPARRAWLRKNIDRARVDLPPPRAGIWGMESPSGGPGGLPRRHRLSRRVGDQLREPRRRRSSSHRKRSSSTCPTSRGAVATIGRVSKATTNANVAIALAPHIEDHGDVTILGESTTRVVPQGPVRAT